MEHFIIAKDGLKLFVREWKTSAAKLVFCIVHGLGEHSGRYTNMAEFLQNSGYTVISFDLRGHGRSEGRRGDSPLYEFLMDDIQIFLDHVKTIYPGLNFFLYGHSLGGNLVINYSLRRAPDVRAVIASAPALKQTLDPPVWQLFLVKLLYRLLPGLTIKSGLDVKAISRVAAIIDAYKADSMVHDKITPRFALEFLGAGLWALDNASQLKLPLLIVHGGKDQITSSDASKEFAERAGEICDIKIWSDAYHEIHNEPEKEELFQFIVKWIDKISKQ